MIGQETLLKNFVGGHWEPASAAQAIPVRNPATGDVLAEAPLSGAADVAKAVAGRLEGAAGLAPHARRRSHSAALPTEGVARRQLQRDRQAGHAGVRQDARRVGRRAETRHRERRGGDRHPVADDGQQPRRHRVGHRRTDDPTAGRRRRGHHAVQLPRHDPAVVPALRRGVRQHRRPQAIGEDAAHDGARAATDRASRFPARAS